MGNQKYADDGRGEQYHVHCPYCDTQLFSASEVADLNYKCIKCHRRYLINIKDGSVSIVLTYKPQKRKDND